ncbi:MAG TPA: hypothetical protein VG012_07625, partial [Acidimicrobiia bacterium]|nr:hypothetical protein [Acidimicrobiia bacterium]
MTAMPEPAHLRAVDAPVADPLGGEGLSLAYAALERLAADHDLDRFTVVVDDRHLGRQVLSVPRSALPSEPPSSGWSAEPPLDADTDVELTVALCRLALRTATIDDARTPVDALELELRCLAEVEAVAMDTEDHVVRVQLEPGASGDALIRRVRDLATARLGRSVVLEIVRRGGTPSRPELTPIAWAPPAPVEVVAVLTHPESDEIEVHLTGGDVRTVGRAALSRGLLGGAEATLDAWHARPGASRRGVAWVHPVDTESVGQCVVALALEDPAADGPVHGIGHGPSPVE